MPVPVATDGPTLSPASSALLRITAGFVTLLTGWQLHSLVVDYLAEVVPGAEAEVVFAVEEVAEIESQDSQYWRVWFLEVV